MDVPAATEDSSLSPVYPSQTRPILDQAYFDESFGLRDPGPPLTPWQDIKRIGRKQWSRLNGSGKGSGRGRLYSYAASWLPAIEWVPKYDFRKLAIPDIVAGITVGVMNVPQGMAYALLAGLPPVCGLYTSFIPTLFYFVMGTSRQCSLGTFAVTSMMTAQIINTYAPVPETSGNSPVENDTMTTTAAPLIGAFTADEMQRIQAGAITALMVGCWQLLFGILGLGAFTVYLSDQLVQGFTCAAAFHVFTSQLKNVFGVKDLPEYHGLFKIAKTYYRFFQVVDTAHPPTMIIALVTIVILVVIKYGLNANRRVKSILRVPVPAELIVVIIGAAVSYVYNFESVYNVQIVQKVPRGMPPATLPNFSIIPDILGQTFAIAIVTFAITVTLGMVFASKHNYSLSPNQEFKALGVGNIVGSWFQCFPSGASLARSAVQDDTGGRTQFVSLVQCTIVLVVILALGPLLEPLPKPVLGSIVMVALLHLLEQVVQLYHLWKLSFIDWTIFLVVFVAVLVLDVDIGVAIGVVYAIMTVMFRLQKPKVRGLGRLPGTELYRPTEIYSRASTLPNIKIVRVDAPIYFANAAYIKTRLYNLAGLNDAMNQLRKDKDDTVDESSDEARTETAYAFTNSLAMGVENEEDAAVVRRDELEAVDGRRDLEMGRVSSPASTMANGEVRTAVPESVHYLIVDCSEVCFMDVTGVAFIKKTHTECKNVGVALLLVNTNKPVRDILAMCGGDAFIAPQQQFVTVHDAVLYAQQKRETARRLRATASSGTIDKV